MSTKAELRAIGVGPGLDDSTNFGICYSLVRSCWKSEHMDPPTFAWMLSVPNSTRYVCMRHICVEVNFFLWNLLQTHFVPSTLNCNRDTFPGQVRSRWSGRLREEVSAVVLHQNTNRKHDIEFGLDNQVEQTPNSSLRFCSMLPILWKT